MQAEEIPNDTVAISESGINAVLIGETLMRAKNVPEKMRELLLRED